MKKLLLAAILLFLFCSSSLAQTKILDRTVEFDISSCTLTLYLSDSLVTDLTVKVGDSFGASNSINETYEINPATIEDNMLVVPLSALTDGDHFFEVAITSQNESSQMMQFKVHH